MGLHENIIEFLMSSIFIFCARRRSDIDSTLPSLCKKTEIL